MNSSKFLFSISVVVALATTASDAQIILRIDFSERGADPASTTQSGFDPFVIDSVGSVSLAQTNSTSRTIGSLTVTLSGNGSDRKSVV